MDIQFGRLANLGWLWLVAALAVLVVGAAVARHRAWKRFATPNLIPRLAPPTVPGRRLRALLPLAAAALMVLALVDVRWGKSWREVPQKGIEVMFVLDVSRSMLAEDAAPNRLSRAKSQISDMIDEMAGDRVGLVVFAGQAERQLPLTSHYDDFRRTLQQVSPSSVRRGGSRLGEALQLAAESFLQKTADHKAIVVFTDGESHEGDPVAVAQQLRDEAGIRVFTVGLGDMQQGARIPLQSSGGQRTYLQHHGQPVWSKLDAETLRQIAVTSGGAFIPAGTKRVDMARVYHGYVADVQQQQFETARIRTYVPRFQWFVGAALACLLAETFWPAGHRPASRRTHRHASEEDRRLRPLASASQAAAVLLVACMSPIATIAVAAGPPTAAEWVRQGHAAMQQQDFARAAERYEQAMTAAPDRFEPVYNAGVAHYRQGNLPEAAERFREALSTPDRRLEARARFNLGNVDYRHALQAAESDPETAVAHLRSAIDHYRAALSASADHVDARANIELAHRLMQQLQDAQHPPASTSPQEDSQDDAQEDREASPDQSPQQEPQQQESQQQDSQQQDSQQQDSQQQDSKQQDSKQQDSQQQESQQQDSQQESRQEPSQQAQSAQAPPQQPQTGEQPPQQEQPGKTPSAGDQQQADGQPRARQGERSKSGGSARNQQAQAAQQPALPMTVQEAEKMLQAIRDRELLRQLEQQRRMQRSHIPVDRDW